MMKNIFVCVLIVIGIFNGIIAKPTENHVDLNLKRVDGKWMCGNIQCPDEGYGCKIIVKTDGAFQKVLGEEYTCVVNDKTGKSATSNIIKMPKDARTSFGTKTIYQDTGSFFRTGFGVDGHEFSKGFITPENWNKFRE